MVPVIRIGDAQWERLKQWAVALEDTPDTALRKVLDAAEDHRQCLASHLSVPTPKQQLVTEEPEDIFTEGGESMLIVVSDPQDSNIYQNQFMETLDRTKTGKFKCTIAWRPDSVKTDKVGWFSQGFWWYSHPLPNRWWNTFGLEQPMAGAILRITCEINISTKGLNRRIAGAFVRDDGGHVFLAHRGGPIGGGKKGITKAGFWKMYSGKWAMALDGGEMTRFALITEVGGDTVASDVAAFVKFVSMYKQSA